MLYVSGRPNWEFKFLRRALEGDDQIELAGLVRIARRTAEIRLSQSSEPGRRAPLFDGFDHPDAETAERADEPVLIGLGKQLDGVERAARFPKTADELYRYHAIVLDDIEAGFFTADQLTLLRNFVSQRGGGLLMLGGPDSFASGKYDRTPVGELLPVYLNRPEPVPGGRGISPGADARRLAAALGSIAEDRGRRAPAAGRDDRVPDAQPRRRNQAGGGRPGRSRTTAPA